MERTIRQLEKDVDDTARLGRKCTEHASSKTRTHRRFSCASATRAASFVAIGTSSLTQDICPDHSLAKPNIKNEEHPRTQQLWGHGVGWRKLTERGILKAVPSSSGYLAVEGCTAGFCIASYEGTKEEQAVLQGGLYTVETVFKVSPGGAFDGQAVCILLDMAKVAEGVEQLQPHAWIHVAVHYASDSTSIWVANNCLGEGVKLHRNRPFIPLNTSLYSNQVGVGVYGMTRVLIRSFRIRHFDAQHDTEFGGQPSLIPLKRQRFSPTRVEDDVVANGEQGVDLLQLVENELVWPSPGISFEDIIALSSAKDALRESVLLPLQMPNVLTGLLEPPKGLMLFGPPGTGKTMLANAIASTPGVCLFRCSPATLTSKWRGESEKLLRALFTVARARAPSVLFFDEADALCSKRGGHDEHEASKRFKAELLQQIDSLHHGTGSLPSLQSSEATTALGSASLRRSPHVVVVAATNAPWNVDEALRRRLEKRLLIPLPDFRARKELLVHLLRQQKLDTNVDLEEVARRTDGFSCADLRSLCREAAMQPVRRLLKGLPPDTTQEALELTIGKQSIGLAEFESALQATRPSVSADAALKFIEWDKAFGSS